MRVLSLRIVMLVVAYLPARVRLRAIRWLARLRYRRYHFGIRPQAANLRDRLGASATDAEQILRRAFELELLAIVDGIRCRSARPEDFDPFIALDGLHHLDDALSAGRGAVLTTGHVDGLTILFMALGAKGYRPHLIRLEAHGRKRRVARMLYERYNRRLERHGCTNLWMSPGGAGAGIRAMRALRTNAVVISPIDLTQSEDNAQLTFLGGPGLFPRGMALLAKTADAPLLDVFVFRGTSGRLVGEIGPAIRVTDVDAAVRHSAGALEAQIRRHPADWLPWHVFDGWRDLPSVDAADEPQLRERTADADRPIAGA